MKRAIIKESFTSEDRYSGALLVTPKSFNSVKSWRGYQVEGLAYYVNKAVSLGASQGEKPKQKRAKVKTVNKT